MCLQIDSKEKNKLKKRGKQDGTKDSGTIFFCRGVDFLFLNEGCSLSMSKFLLLLLSLVISCLRSKIKLLEFVFSLQPLESVNGNKTQKVMVRNTLLAL